MVRNGGQGYANEVLWPLCHVTLDRVFYRKAFWSGYQALNRRFADTVLDELDKRPAAVWIHDYHLGILPALIKKESPDTTICHFWHVPWPGPDVLPYPAGTARVARMSSSSRLSHLPDYVLCDGVCRLCDRSSWMLPSPSIHLRQL